MYSAMQVIREHLQNSARSFGLGDLQIDLVMEGRSVKVYATTPNPAARHFIETYPAMLDEFEPSKRGGFTDSRVAEWKLVNAAFGFVAPIDGDAFFYLERHAERGNIHPMLDEVVRAIFRAFTEHLHNVKTERVPVTTYNRPVESAAAKKAQSTTPERQLVLNVLNWLAWLTKPRVIDIPYKPKGIYPSSGKYVEDVQKEKLLMLIQALQEPGSKVMYRQLCEDE